MLPRPQPFGIWLRRQRLAAGHTLRGFAELIGVSPTYLSQVEQGRADPPTAERARRIAEVLDEEPDQLIALAGRLPEDLTPIIHREPLAMPQLLRLASGLSSVQLAQLTEHVRVLRSETPRG